MKDQSPSREARPTRTVFHRSLIATSIAVLLVLYPTAHFVSSEAYANGSAAPAAAAAVAPPSVRTVNAPYYGTGDTFTNKESAIFWFGQVNSTDNYADVRIGYNDNALMVYVAVFDNRLWTDPARDVNAIEQWDSSTLYLDTGADPVALSLNSFKFSAQVANQTVALRHDSRGNNGSWSDAALDISAKPGWRGNGFNQGQDTRGWNMLYRIPFATLGVSTPTPGTTWRLGMAVHDRDDVAGTPISDKSWPETFVDGQPGSWGRLVFGLPSYSPPNTAGVRSIDIAHKLNGAVVQDGQVGGGAVCGENTDFWTQWGYVVNTLSSNVNVQNQVDVADWPCYSKYYVTFPLDQIPAGQAIVSANLTLFQMGQGGAPGLSQPSLIQIMTLSDDWDANTLNWNNAPLALENVSRSWVESMGSFTDWASVPARTWDLSYAVAQAYASGRPLRLVFYSADEDYHSGKYFVSSDTGDWNAVHRPKLNITFGIPNAGGPPANTPTPTPAPTAGPTDVPTPPPPGWRARAYLPSLFN